MKGDEGKVTIILLAVFLLYLGTTSEAAGLRDRKGTRAEEWVMNPKQIDAILDKYYSYPGADMSEQASTDEKNKPMRNMQERRYNAFILKREADNLMEEIESALDPEYYHPERVTAQETSESFDEQELAAPMAIERKMAMPAVVKRYRYPTILRRNFHVPAVIKREFDAPVVIKKHFNYPGIFQREVEKNSETEMEGDLELDDDHLAMK